MLHPGDVIGDYEVLGLLGTGGMGSVYMVRDRLLQRIEAMKILQPALRNDATVVKRFLRELATQTRLRHDNIVRVTNTFRHADLPILVMEYVEGTKLKDVLQAGPLPVQRSLGWMVQVLSALECVHVCGIVHRDVKPDNIMVTPHGSVKLMDFGIAKGNDQAGLTKPGCTLGSLYYMSPEQIQGTDRLDQRADVYSAGVTLYEMTTGRRPFDGHSEFSVMAAHIQGTPMPPIHIDPSLPEALNNVILKAIAKDRNQRFQTAAEFRAALVEVVFARYGRRRVPSEMERRLSGSVNHEGPGEPRISYRGLSIPAGSLRQTAYGLIAFAATLVGLLIAFWAWIAITA